MEKLPPQNIEAEEAVLGAILVNPDVILSVGYILSPDDFYRQKNGWIYEAAVSLHGRREPIDFLTVCDEMEKREQLNEVGGPAYITGLINAAPFSFNAEAYARIIANCANNRRLIDMAGRITVLAYSDGDSSMAYSKAQRLLRDLPFSGKTTEVAGGQNIISEMLSDLVKAQMEKERRKDGAYEATWPWEAMQRMARWRIGQPVILVAEGGAGKTAFCTAVGVHNAINGGRIFYVATEDEPSILRKRIMASISGVPYLDIEMANHTKDTSTANIGGINVVAPTRLMNAVRGIERNWKGEFHIVPAVNRTVPEIIYDLARLEADKGVPDAVIFDWFLDHRDRESDNKVSGLIADIQDLKGYTADHKTRILTATQIGKSSAGKRYTSLDAFYTSAWSHYGKLALSLKRERELVNGEAIGPYKPQIEVFISKANLDRTGSFILAMRGETLSIYEPEIETINLGYAYD